MSNEQQGEKAYSSDEVVSMGVPKDYVDDVVELSQRLEDLSGDLLHPLVLVRFLTFLDNVTSAEAAVRIVDKWRSDVGLPRIMQEWGVHDADGGWRRQPQTPRAMLSDQHFCAGRISSTTMDGRPLIVARAGAWDVDGVVSEGLTQLMLNQYVFMLEDVLQSGFASSMRQKKLVSGAAVIDVDGISLSVLRHLPALADYAKITNQFFPDLVDSITIVNAPFIFTQIWRIGSLVLAPSTRKKFQILGSNFAEGLRSHAKVDIKALPQFLGGEVSDTEIPPAQKVTRGESKGMDLAFGPPGVLLLSAAGRP